MKRKPLRVHQLTDQHKKIARRLAKESQGGLPSPVSIYARMALALAKERGITLSADDCYAVLVMDDAPGTALAEAMVREEEAHEA